MRILRRTPLFPPSLPPSLPPHPVLGFSQVLDVLLEVEGGIFTLVVGTVAQPWGKGGREGGREGGNERWSRTSRNL
jgi:hypothetical protein